MSEHRGAPKNFHDTFEEMFGHGVEKFEIPPRYLRVPRDIRNDAATALGKFNDPDRDVVEDLRSVLRDSAEDVGLKDSSFTAALERRIDDFVKRYSADQFERLDADIFACTGNPDFSHGGHLALGHFPNGSRCVVFVSDDPDVPVKEITPRRGGAPVIRTRRDSLRHSTYIDLFPPPKTTDNGDGTYTHTWNFETDDLA